MKRWIITAIALLFASLFALGGCSACDNGNETSSQSSAESSVMENSRDLNVNMSNEQIKVGDVLKIEATSVSGTTVSFLSTDEKVATVDQTGLVTAKSVGTAFILVSAGTAEKSVKITVVQDVFGVMLEQSDIKLCLGTTHDIKATLTKNGVPYSDESVVWTFVAEEGTLADIADCSSVGNKASVKTKTVGNITVVATFGEISATCRITILNASAIALETPMVTVNNHDTLSWNEIEGAAGYAVKINDEQWITTTETIFEIKDLADNFDELSVQVKAISGQNTFDYYDSLIAKAKISHEWEAVTSDIAATCTTPAKVRFECKACDREKEVAGYYGPHEYADLVADLYHDVDNDVYGICKVCGQYQSPAVNYVYDETTDSYIVSGIDVSKLSETDGAIYVASTYDDEIHGKKAVTGIGYGACSRIRSLKRIYLPSSVILVGDSAFAYCSSLEFVAMPGVTQTWDTVRDQTTGEITKLGITNAFLRSNSIREVIVNKAFTLSTQAFYSNYNDGQTTINLFVLGNADESSVRISGNNNMLTGYQYYLPRDFSAPSCGEWEYNNGIIEHIKDHIFENGTCTRCGTVDGKGVVYTYGKTKDADGNEIEGYFVSGLDDFEGTELNVLEQYNDGAHGILPVVGVGTSALASNDKIKKVVLPETVYAIGDSAFGGCSALETVIMPGVVSNANTARNQIGTNAFIDCSSLTTLVVGELWANATQIFLVRPDRVAGYEAKLNVYATKAKAETIIRYANWVDRPESVNILKQNMFTGNTYYYDIVGGCGSWRWAGNVYGGEIELQSEHDYTGEKGACVYCGSWDPKGIEYSYGTITLQNTLQVGAERVQEFTGYIVKGLQSTHTGTEVIIPAVYNDGINGEASVIAVASNAFMRNNTIVKVTLPQTVLSIGTSAFYECTALTTVIMPGVVDVFRDVTTGGMNIGDNAFTNCIALETIVISTANQIAGQKFFVNTGTYTDYTAKLKVYRYDADGKAEFSATCRFYKHNQANMFITNTQNNGTPTESELANGGYYLYSAEAPTAEDWAKTAYWWHYDANGNVVAWEKA